MTAIKLTAAHAQGQDGEGAQIGNYHITVMCSEALKHHKGFTCLDPIAILQPRLGFLNQVHYCDPTEFTVSVHRSLKQKG